jgi:acyl carrier protein
MTVQELYSAVSPVAEQVLRIPRFDSSVTMMSTPAWDSLKHVQLLAALERKLGIEIDADAAFKLTSADKLIKYLHAALSKEPQA